MDVSEILANRTLCKMAKGVGDATRRSIAKSGITNAARCDIVLEDAVDVPDNVLTTLP